MCYECVLCYVLVGMVWMCSTTHSHPRRFTPGKDAVTIVQEAGWATGPVWKREGFDHRTVQPVVSRFTFWSTQIAEFCSRLFQFNRWIKSNSENQNLTNVFLLPHTQFIDQYFLIENQITSLEYQILNFGNIQAHCSKLHIHKHKNHTNLLSKLQLKLSGVDSASKRNEFQKYFLGVKAVGA
jgi:hypothetical protein